MTKKRARDVEKTYTQKQLIAKMRRLIDALQTGKRFTIQIAGERMVVPVGAIVTIAHERSTDEEEIEFQITWKRH